MFLLFSGYYSFEFNSIPPKNPVSLIIQSFPRNADYNKSMSEVIKGFNIQR